MGRRGYWLFDRGSLLPILFEHGHVAFAVYCLLISNAAVSRMTVNTAAGDLLLNRGDVLVSQRKLAEGIGASSATVHRWIKRFIACGFLKHQAEHAARHDTKHLVKQGLLVLTVCNYERYCRAAAVNETPDETPCETPIETAGENNRKNLVKKEPTKKQPVEKQSPLPPDGDEAFEIIRRAVDTVAPGVSVDEFTVARWLRDISANPWWIAAALIDNPAGLRDARTSAFLTAILRRRIDEGYDAGGDPRGYVEFSLHPQHVDRLSHFAGGVA
jgi:hypothetical protein